MAFHRLIFHFIDYCQIDCSWYSSEIFSVKRDSENSSFSFKMFFHMSDYMRLLRSQFICHNFQRPKGPFNRCLMAMDIPQLWGPPRGVPVPLFPWNKLACSPVPPKSKICFLMFPVPQYCLCSPVLLKIWPLFPWNKCPVSPVPQNPWKGLNYVRYCHFPLWCNHRIL